MREETALFVYGTLMPGHSRWPVLAPYALATEPATAEGRLWDTGLGYPAARFEAGGGLVPGTRVALVAGAVGDVLSLLDRVEVEGTLFRRVEITTSAGPAIAYEWIGPIDGMPRLHDGWPGNALP